ncbi:MAG: hypothetical protein JSV68_11570, partial [Anaerolineaceae bacterium]
TTATAVPPAATFTAVPPTATDTTMPPTVAPTALSTETSVPPTDPPSPTATAVLAKTTVNATLEGKVSASSFYQGFSPALAVDGDRATSWFEQERPLTAGSPSTNGAYLRAN